MSQVHFGSARELQKYSMATAHFHGETSDVTRAIIAQESIQILSTNNRGSIHLFINF
jgi:hypothetical protein